MRVVEWDGEYCAVWCGVVLWWVGWRVLCGVVWCVMECIVQGEFSVVLGVMECTVQCCVGWNGEYCAVQCGVG